MTDVSNFSSLDKLTSSDEPQKILISSSKLIMSEAIVIILQVWVSRQYMATINYSFTESGGNAKGIATEYEDGEFKNFIQEAY
ncbi:MAG: hypothetical protein LE180_04200 [Endomicrobium sp.]|nr:hypothetical protein [Endomicrobium sp.]